MKNTTFRNVLVHLYWRLDLDTIYEILHQDLGVLKDFINIIKRL
ncbi:MAG: DUF86 domain-containing protein [Methanosarcinales archaeon]|nr:DUF86 domain-containing protein [Methanosarcinales archaeon]